MMYIIEGSDCSGKTTLVNKLIDKLGYKYKKGSSFILAKAPNEELFNHFKSIAKMDNVIVDRFIYSNRTYADLYKDYSIITQKQKQQIEDMISRKAKVIYLFADDEILQERMRQRGDEYINENEIPRITKKFSEVMLNATILVMSYDTGEWSSDEIADDIVNCLHNEEVDCDER